MVYQGSHGGGVASAAHLVLPVLTYVESAMFYKNLLGNVKRSAVAVSYNLLAKTNVDVFRMLLTVFNRQVLFGFSTLNFYLSVSFNRNLAVAQEYLYSGAFYLPPVSASVTKLTESAIFFSSAYYYLHAYGSFFIIGKNKQTATFFSPLSRVASTPLSSVILNYYGDPNLTLLGASRTMNLCSNLILKRNFSFAQLYS